MPAKALKNSLIFLQTLMIILTVIIRSSPAHADGVSYPPFALQESLRKSDFSIVYSQLNALAERANTDPAAEEELYATFSVLGQIGRAIKGPWIDSSQRRSRTLAGGGRSCPRIIPPN